MNRTAAFLIALMVMLSSSLVANAQLFTDARLLAEGTADEYWICRVGRSGTGESASDVTRVFQRADRVGGGWNEIARLQAVVIDAAPLGNRLAVLLDNGDWKVLQAGSSALGTPLPSPYRIATFAGDGQAMLAVAIVDVSSATVATTAAANGPEASRPAVSAVFRWASDTWTRVADLPSGLNEHTTVAPVNGTIYALGRVGEKAQLWSYAEKKWKLETSFPVPEGTVLKLIENAPRAIIASQDDAGAWSIRDVAATQPARSFERHLPSDLALIGPTLRLVYVKENRIEQVAFDDYGAGPEYPPVTVAQLPLPASAVQGWAQIAGLVLLTITMLLTFRQRPAMPDDVLKNAPFRVAPLGRRFAAGVIDAVPALGGMAYIVQQQAQLETGSPTVAMMLPYVIGVGIYLVHVTISECLTGRSLGKFLFGMRVVNYDGSRPSVDRIVFRNLLRLVDLMFYAPLLLVLLTPMRQRIGDLAGKTLVVMEGREEDSRDLDD